jgi:hypothetical protein
MLLLSLLFEVDLTTAWTTMTALFFTFSSFYPPDLQYFVVPVLPVKTSYRN